MLPVTLLYYTMSKKLKTLRLLSCLYIMGFFFFGLYDSILPSSLYSLIPIAIFTTAILIHSSIADKIIGYLLLISSAYMLIAVTSDIPKVTKVTNQTIMYFSFGYGIFSLGFAASLFITCYRSLQNRYIERSAIAN